MKKSRSHVGVMATAVFSSIWPVAIGVGLSLLIVKLAFPHAAFEARPAHSRSQGSQSQSIYAIAVKSVEERSERSMTYREVQEMLRRAGIVISNVAARIASISSAAKRTQPTTLKAFATPSTRA